jgi:acetyl esterase
MQGARKGYARGTARFMKSEFVRGALLSMPRPEYVVDNLDVIGSEHQRIPIRVYRPQLAKQPGRPVLLLSHGGGFCLGGLDTEEFICTLLCRQLDLVVVNIGYRLTPEASYEQLVQDVFDVVTWVGDTGLHGNG